jgi:hypothetical protein
MGLFKKPSWTSSYLDSSIKPNVNPNPNNFRIEAAKKIGSFWVSIIRYPNCTNFEGKKVLLTEFDPRNRTFLDPHFTPGSGLIARFEPTVKGVELAKQMANFLNR